MPTVARVPATLTGAARGACGELGGGVTRGDRSSSSLRAQLPLELAHLFRVSTGFFWGRSASTPGAAETLGIRSAYRRRPVAARLGQPELAEEIVIVVDGVREGRDPLLDLPR